MHSRYPKTGSEYALEFDIKHAGIVGIAWNINTLLKQRWNTSMEWTSMVSQEDLLELYQKRTGLETTLDAMGLDPTKLPVKTVTRQVDHQQHADFQARMMSLVRGDKPATAQPQSEQQACPLPSLFSRTVSISI